MNRNEEIYFVQVRYLAALRDAYIGVICSRHNHNRARLGKKILKIERDSKIYLRFAESCWTALILWQVPLSTMSRVETYLDALKIPGVRRNAKFCLR